VRLAGNDGALVLRVPVEVQIHVFRFDSPGELRTVDFGDAGAPPYTENAQLVLSVQKMVEGRGCDAVALVQCQVG